MNNNESRRISEILSANLNKERPTTAKTKYAINLYFYVPGMFMRKAFDRARNVVK